MKSNGAVVGIDPGLTGALALLVKGVYRDSYMMPVQEKTHGKGKQVDAAQLQRIIVTWAQNYAPTFVLERVSAHPGQGVSGMFSLGRSVGVIEGIVATCGMPLVWTRPQEWKGRCGLLRKDKAAALTLAAEVFPQVRQGLTKKKDLGLADALLIAAFGV